MDVLAGAHDAAVQMIDTSVVGVRQQAPASLGTEGGPWAVAAAAIALIPLLRDAPHSPKRNKSI